MKPFFRVGDIVRFTQDFHKAWDDDASHAVITEVWNSTTPASSSIDSLPRIVATIFKNDFDDKIASQPCGTGTNIECVPTGEYADLGYATSSKIREAITLEDKARSDADTARRNAAQNVR